jgi:hypothetical protein
MLAEEKECLYCIRGYEPTYYHHRLLVEIYYVSIQSQSLLSETTAGFYLLRVVDVAVMIAAYNYCSEWNF